MNFEFTGDTGQLRNNTPRESAGFTGGITGNTLLMQAALAGAQQLTNEITFDHPGGVTDVRFVVVNVDANPSTQLG